MSQQDQQNAAEEQMQRLEMLDYLTVLFTAFGSWSEFKTAMEVGYTPTIRTEKLRKNASKQSRWDNNAKYLLRELVRHEGFKVFDGQSVR